MERGTHQSETIIYSNHEEPIVLSKPLFDILLKEDDPTDLISLYCFYYYTAKWQQTTQPKATDKYCMAGLKFGWDRFARAKKRLTQLGLIDVLKIGQDKGNGIGWFIKINFIWGKKNISKNPENLVLGNPTKTNQNPKKQELGFQGINALKTNIIITDKISNKKSSIAERNKKYLPLARKLSSIIRTTKNMKHTPNQIRVWTNNIRQLEEGNGVEYARIEGALEWYRKNIGGEYIPVIESGSSLQYKFMKLEIAMNKKKPTNDHKPGEIRYDGAKWEKHDGVFQWTKYDDECHRYILDNEDGLFKRFGIALKEYK